MNVLERGKENQSERELERFNFLFGRFLHFISFEWRSKILFFQIVEICFFFF